MNHKQKTRIKSCDSKQRYVSHEAADAFIKEMGTELCDEVYPCKICDGFHITTIKGKDKIKARRVSEKIGLKKIISKFKNRRSR